MATDTTAKQKAVLGSLLTRADALAKKVISVYSPSVKYNTNLQNIKRLNAEHIEAAATFLGFCVRAENKKLYKNLSVLSDRVILRIESLFESTCLECSETYCNTLTDKPPLTCHLCMQGSHNCERIKEKAKSTPRPGGSVWLCFDCFKKNDLTLMSIEQANGSLETVEEEEKNSEESEDDRDSPRRNRQKENNSDAPICEAYKRRECPHGLTGKREVEGKPCPNQHPPRCFRWCKHGDNKRVGCTKGDECRYFHPKLCRSSVLKRFCPNQNCTYHHLKHTRRPKENQDTRNPDRRGRRKSSTIPPPPSGLLRYDSASTLNGTPYVPTIQKRTTTAAKTQDLNDNNNNNKPPVPRDSNDRSDAFLFQLLENMKEGIVNQVSDRLVEFQSMIPEMVKEQVLMTRPAQALPMFQMLPHQQLPHQQLPHIQTAQSMPSAAFLNQFPGSSF